MVGDITKISQMAKAHLAQDTDVIDATSGMFYDDNGIIGYSKIFERLRNKISPNDRYRYAGVSGGKVFEENILKWLFGSHKLTPLMSVFATMGATGAVSNAFDLFGKPGTKVLVSDLYWHNYLLMADIHQMELTNYQMFKADKLSFDDFIEKANNIIEHQNNLIIILNQPAHNPTGYSFSKQEMNDFISIINDLSQIKPVVLIYDIAYLDLDKEAGHLNILGQIIPNVTVILAYSFSKSLGLYGLRLGASIMITHNHESIERFKTRSQLISRTKWSTPNQEAVVTFNKIMSSKKYINKVNREIEQIKIILNLRAKLLISLLEEEGISYYPYHQGFFITIPCEGSIKLFERLRTRKVYLIPLEKGIRIAIATLKTCKIKTLVEHLKAVI